MNKEAIYQFKQCLSLDQQHFGAAIHLATQLANLGDYTKAQKYFKHSLRLNPQSVPAHFGLAKILHQAQDEIDEALKHYRYVVENDSGHYKALC